MIISDYDYEFIIMIIIMITYKSETRTEGNLEILYEIRSGNSTLSSLLQRNAIG